MRSILGGRAECPSRLAVELGTAMERALVQAGVVGKMDFEELFKPVKSSYSARWTATHSTVTTALHPLSQVVLATNLQDLNVGYLAGFLARMGVHVRLAHCQAPAGHGQGEEAGREKTGEKSMDSSR